MYSLILSLLLACNDNEVDPEQQAREEAEKQRELMRKKQLKKIKDRIFNGMNDEGLKEGIAFYTTYSDPQVEALLVAASHQVGNIDTATELLEKAAISKPFAQEMKFRLLLQKADKSAAADFAKEIEDSDLSTALLLEAIRAGAIVDSSDLLVVAGKEIITSKAAASLEALEDVSSPAAKRIYTELALEADRKDLSVKHLEALQKSKDPKDQFTALVVEEKYVEALQLAHKHHLILKGSELIEKQSQTADIWNVLSQAQAPLSLLKRSSWLRIPYAKVAIQVGEYSTALKLINSVQSEYKEKPLPDSLVYVQGLAAFLVRDHNALVKIAEVKGEYQTLFKGLRDLAQGKSITRAIFDQRTPQELVQMVLHTAPNSQNIAEEMLPFIMKDAEESGNAATHLSALFMQEAFLRTYKGESTIELLDQIELQYGVRYPNIKAEIAIRKHVQGAEVLFMASTEASISERAWQSYLAGAIPTAAEPVPQLLSSMQILKQRKGYESYINMMWQKTPIHRIGPLSTNTVLDLSHGLRFDDAVTGFIGTQNHAEVAQSLVFQDLARRTEILQKDGFEHRNPVYGMAAANREALLDATARVRVQMAQYWVGGAFPESELQQLHRVEERLLMNEDEVASLKQKQEQEQKEQALKEKAEQKAEKKPEAAEKKPEEAAKKTEAESGTPEKTEKKPEAESGTPEKTEKKEEPKKPVAEKKKNKKSKKIEKSLVEVQFDSIREDFSYRTLVLKNPVDLNFMQSSLRKIVILSYRIHNDRLIGVAFADASGQVLDLGPINKFVDLSNKQKALLIQDSVDPKTLASNSANHSVANTLKNKMTEPFNETSQRLVSMVFIVPPELEQFSFGTLPDQQNGLRFLNGMRRVSSVPGISELMRSVRIRNTKLQVLAIAEEVENSPKSDLLRSGKENQPVEIDQLSLSFKSSDRKVLIGESSSMEKYRKFAPTSRYIYFAQAKSSSEGGFILKGEELTLSEITATPLKAQVIFISEHPDPKIQSDRVHAFLNAGARNVLVFDWELSNQKKRLILDKIFELLLREEPITEAVSKVSKSSLGLQSRENVKQNGPGSWGALHLYGYPDRIGN